MEEGPRTPIKDIWCREAKSGKHDYATEIAREDCADGYLMRAGDSVNYAIGQGDTLLTPIQEAKIYSALANGGTMYQPSIGKAIVSADGSTVQRDQAEGGRPACRTATPTIKYIDKALEGVVTSGTAAWKFGGWPQDKIALHAKTGTAEVYGKQTTSWFATYTKDYAIIMTISQGGTGSGGSGAAVRKIYEALYGVQSDGSIDADKALLPGPNVALPKFGPDGLVQQAAWTTPVARAFANPPVTQGPSAAGGDLAALPPDRNQKLLLGRRYQA